MALVRFVNGLCDARHGGAYARSVAGVRAEIRFFMGFPAFFDRKCAFFEPKKWCFEGEMGIF
jgi:hypothetical protein